LVCVTKDICGMTCSFFVAQRFISKIGEVAA